MKEPDFVQIAKFLDRAVKIALVVQETSGKMIKDFVDALEGHKEVAELKKDVREFARSFPMPGFDPSMIPESVRLLGDSH